MKSNESLSIGQVSLSCNICLVKSNFNALFAARFILTYMILHTLFKIHLF